MAEMTIKPEVFSQENQVTLRHLSGDKDGIAMLQLDIFCFHPAQWYNGFR